VQMVLSALSQINYGLILFVFVIYFLLGYLFYSAMYAAMIGAAAFTKYMQKDFAKMDLNAVPGLELGEE